MDKRNVLDEFKGMPHDDIVRILESRGVTLEIAVENTLRDYNLGTIVRSANAFGIRRIHIIGRRQWNKRGAMKTDAYLSFTYHETAEAFSAEMHRRKRFIIAVENNVKSVSIYEADMPADAVLLFGQEGAGISPSLLDLAGEVVSIDQLGSTRSINVGVAAGIAMFEWCRQHRT